MARVTGFTLLEVVLALAIVLGLLVVVLFFHQQTARLRDHTLTDTAGLAAVRLCLDRLATELRSASSSAGTFRGGPQDIEFLRCDFSAPLAWAVGTNAASSLESFPVRRVRYGFRPPAEDGAGGGVSRDELPFRPASQDLALDAVDPVGYGLFSIAGVGPAEGDSGDGGASPDSLGSGSLGVVLSELRYFQLRYWDGVAWSSAWANDHLPRGVEITVATESLPVDAPPDAMPVDVFRRVVALPTAPVLPVSVVESELGLPSSAGRGPEGQGGGGPPL